MSASVALPSNRSYEIRVAFWDRVTPDGTPLVGVLEIREQKNIRHKVRVRRYAVAEQVAQKEGRKFRVTKPGGADWYHCRLATDPKGEQSQHDECECHQYLKGTGPCVHLQALRALLTRGELPPTTPTLASVRPAAGSVG
jgi:hypothetical protein